MARDVILTAYASSPQAPCVAWAKLFREEPLILAIPGSPGTLIRTGKYWAATGDAFRAAVKELAPQYQDLEIRRRGVVTFSAGWNWVHQVLTSPYHRSTIDACIIMEGLQTAILSPWVNLAMKAIRKETWLLMAHNNTLSEDSNQLVWKTALAAASPAYVHTTLPNYITRPRLPQEGVYLSVPPVRDTEGRMVLPALTKHWTKDSLIRETNRGQLYMLTFEGSERPDHAYLVEQVQPRLWRFLAEHWDSQDEPQTPLRQT